MAINDPSSTTSPVPPAAAQPAAGPDLSAWLLSQFRPVVESVATQATAQAVAVQQSVIAGMREDVTALQADVTAHHAQIEQRLAALGTQAGTAFVGQIARDPWITRAITAAGIALIFLIAGFALAGNPVANRWIGGIPVILVALGFWHSTPGGGALPKLSSSKEKQQ